jgi:hypothetical protein
MSIYILKKRENFVQEGRKFNFIVLCASNTIFAIDFLSNIIQVAYTNRYVIL